jgi:hypothetical protein
MRVVFWSDVDAPSGCGKGGEGDEHATNKMVEAGHEMPVVGEPDVVFRLQR